LGKTRSKRIQTTGRTLYSKIEYCFLLAGQAIYSAAQTNLYLYYKMKTIEAIKNRTTAKLRGNPDQPLPITKGEEHERIVNELLELAGKAPFHHQSPLQNRKGDLMGTEPWRFYVLNTESCRQLLEGFKQGNPINCADGMVQMLASADTLILAYWIPELEELANHNYYPNVKNMEHIAATSAAIQTLLLAATSKGINNYWSSGGCIRKPEVQEYLEVPEEEILLGAIFLFPDDYPATVDVVKGKNQAVRGESKHWMKWVKPG